MSAVDGQAPSCRPYFCPESNNVECCPEHSGFDVCCGRPDQHGPVPCICPEPGKEGPVKWACMVHDGALNPDGSWAR